MLNVKDVVEADAFRESVGRIAVDIVQTIFDREFETLRQALLPEPEEIEPAPSRVSLLAKRRVGDVWQRGDSKYPYTIFAIVGDQTGMQRIGSGLQINVSAASLKSKWRPV